MPRSTDADTARTTPAVAAGRNSLSVVDNRTGKSYDIPIDSGTIKAIVDGTHWVIEDHKQHPGPAVANWSWVEPAAATYPLPAPSTWPWLCSVPLSTYRNSVCACSCGSPR